MSAHYQEIIDSMNQKQPDVLFPKEWLDTLTEKERKDIEQMIIKKCLLGVSAFLPYVSEIKTYPLESIFTPETMVLLDSYQKATIVKTIYQRMNQTIYLNYLLDLAKKDFSVYSMLSFMYQERKSLSLYKDLKRIMEASNDERYRSVFEKRIGEEPHMDSLDNILDTVRAGIFGFAVGDALGVPVEFTSREARKKYPVMEMVGHGSHNVPMGTWSDDTSMTIAAMDVIGNCNSVINYDEIMKAYCKWATKAAYTATGRIFDIGNTTRFALSNYLNRGLPALECGKNDEHSNGNGSLMRMLPIAYYLSCNHLDKDQEAKIIGDYSSLTHAHEISKMGCHLYCDYMKELLQGKSKEEAYEDLGKNDYSKYYQPNTIQLYKRVLDGSLKDAAEESISSSGYVVSTLEASLWASLTSDSYQEGVLKAVNLGEDTDTVGAITGSILGTVYGMNGIPKEWLEVLRRKDYIESICENYCRAVDKGHYYPSGRFDDDVFGPYTSDTGGLQEMIQEEKVPEDSQNVNEK